MTIKLIIGNKNYSSWSLRAWLLLKEAGIEFDEHRIVLDTPESAREIGAFSPAGRVPILQIDDMTVWDTMAIAETLAERWPDKNLWPADAATRAHARAICAEMHAEFAELRSRMPMNCRAMGRTVLLPDGLTNDIDRIIEIWTQCHRRYGDDGDWLFGDFTIADAMFAPVVLRLRTYGINLPESASCYPRRLLDSEAMQEWLAAAESETEIIEGDEAGQ
ncbi:MAG: glutathione S-transferase family protein [Proteobacteria bacterium]|nr:glutathione S-transferase family protein [Pseudomonadota bacterium]